MTCLGDAMPFLFVTLLAGAFFGVLGWVLGTRKTLKDHEPKIIQQ